MPPPSEEAKPVFLLCGALYLVFLLFENQRLDRQRQAIQRIRQWLTSQFGLCNFARGWENEEEGFKQMVLVWILTLLFAALAFFCEGQVRLGMVVVFLASQYVVCLLLRQTKRTITMVARLNLCIQVLSFYYFETQTAGLIMRRAIVVRAVCTLLFFESLEEAFVHLFLLSSSLFTRHGNNTHDADQQHMILLPLQMFFMGVLPMRVLGISEWLSSSAASSSSSSSFYFQLFRTRSFLKAISVACCTVPMYMLFSAYVGRALPRVYFVIGSGLLVCGLALRTQTVGLGLVDKRLTPKTLVFNKSAVQRSQHTVLFRASAAALPVLWLLDLQYAIVLLTTGVVILCVRENRQFSLAQSDLLVWTGGLLVLACDQVWLSGVITFLGTTSTFSCLVAACAREVIFTHVAQDSEAESFLSHAIKQKFASVGAALDQVVSAIRAKEQQDQEDAVSASSHLLSLALTECRIGHDRCHAANVFRQLDLQSGSAASRAHKKAVLELEPQLRLASAAMLLLSPTLTDLTRLRGGNGDGDGVRVNLDWEIFHLVLTSVAGPGQLLSKAWTSRCEIMLRFRQPVQRRHGVAVLSRLVAELGGRIDEEDANLLVIPTQVYNAAATPRTPAAVAVAVGAVMAGGGDAALDQARPVLSRLRIALVDDNVLVRNNMHRILHRMLGVPQENLLICGTSMDDCRQFPRALVEFGADLAIFDQNIDFDSDEMVLKGSELAREAGALGFRGCMLLHSSDVNLMQILHDGRGVFHGALEKTASTHRLVSGIAESWNQFAAAGAAVRA